MASDPPPGGTVRARNTLHDLLRAWDEFDDEQKREMVGRAESYLQEDDTS